MDCCGLPRRRKWWRCFRHSYNIPLVHVEAETLFPRCAGPASTDPELKRKTIGRLFIDVFEAEAKKLGGADFPGGRARSIPT